MIEGILPATVVTFDAPEEGEPVRRAAEHLGEGSDRLLSSAKEPAYEAWYPLARRRLDPVCGTFDARFTGHGVAARGLVLTAIAMTAPPDARKAA